MRGDIDEMLHEVTSRSEKIRKKTEQKIIRIMSFTSCVLGLSLVCVISVLSQYGGAEGTPSVYGSTLIAETAGGYVIVAVISFLLGVLVTYITQRYRRKR